MRRIATTNEIRRILRQSSLDIKERINVSPVQLSFPTDGQSPRIKVSVLPGQKGKVPKMVEFVVNSETLQLPIEASEDYQEYQVQLN